jgi:hypothetical protein
MSKEDESEREEREGETGGGGKRGRGRGKRRVNKLMIVFRACILKTSHLTMCRWLSMTYAEARESLCKFDAGIISCFFAFFTIFCEIFVSTI